MKKSLCLKLMNELICIWGRERLRTNSYFRS